MDREKIEYKVAKNKNLVLAAIRKLVGHRKFSRKKYYGKKINGDLYSNCRISSALRNNEKFLAARYGDTELRVMVYTIENKLGIRRGFPDYIKKAMTLNAGFFPSTDENLMKFGELMIETSKSVDIFGVWFNLLEDYIINKYNKSAELVRLESLEPYRCDKPWSSDLKGKKVLVVHPFSESIKMQYQQREHLFIDKNVLPEFELITYKAVQSNAGGESNYNDWFEALDSMYNDIKAIEFDVAIVGCGAYGMPLSGKIKLLGKTVIHLGGATQLLFGIRGARWDVRPEMQHLFNDYWIRPSDNEKPRLASMVEGGCYW